VRQVGETEVGTGVRMIVVRDGTPKTLKIILGRRETAESSEETLTAPEAVAPVEKDIMGMVLSELTDALREEHGLDGASRGLLVTELDEMSEAFEKGLRAGDVISEAGQQSVASLQDLEERIEDAKDAGRKSLLLLVRRAGEPRYMAIGLQ
jgi:serine protease Do